MPIRTQGGHRGKDSRRRQAQFSAIEVYSRTTMTDSLRMDFVGENTHAKYPSIGAYTSHPAFYDWPCTYGRAISCEHSSPRFLSAAMSGSSRFKCPDRARFNVEITCATVEVADKYFQQQETSKREHLVYCDTGAEAKECRTGPWAQNTREEGQEKRVEAQAGGRAGA
eukprot:2833848-Pleurochrysis_carterae.AAC.1